MHSLLSEPPLPPSSTASTSPPARGVLGTALQADAKAPSECCAELVARALRLGSGDNVTALVVEFAAADASC